MTVQRARTCRSEREKLGEGRKLRGIKKRASEKTKEREERSTRTVC